MSQQTTVFQRALALVIKVRTEAASWGSSIRSTLDEVHDRECLEKQLQETLDKRDDYDKIIQSLLVLLEDKECKYLTTQQIADLRRECGHGGKPREWQRGFDLALRRVDHLLSNSTVKPNEVNQPE
jgi:hypothetical protein